MEGVTGRQIMTIFFPDVSSYTPNVDPAAYPILLARATLSSSVTDQSYATFKAKAAAAGTVFVAYHWLNHGNLQAQAQYCFSVVGPGVPVMIDAEDEAGNTGYNGPLTVADITGFAGAYRALGGTASLCYLPAWYWSGAMSMPDLSPLNVAGLHLVSSNYPSAGYTEDGPGWAPYGGVTPVQWQYTSTPIDLNAYRGSVDDYRRMVGGDSMSDQAESILAAFADGGKQYTGSDGQEHVFVPTTETYRQIDFRALVVAYLNGSATYQTSDGVTHPTPTPPTAVTLTDADRQAIIDGIVSQLGGKLDAIIAKLNAAGKGFQT
jgi:hypothetical protein